MTTQSGKNSTSQKDRNQGEGNQDAAREYDKAATEFAHSGKVKPAAEAAKKSLEGDEAADLAKAEKEGRSHAKS